MEHLIQDFEPKKVYDSLSQIMDAADEGSIITRDNAVNNLFKIASVPAYTSEALTLLRTELLKSAVNQLPKHAKFACD